MNCESCEQRPATVVERVTSVDDGQPYLVFICSDCAKLAPGDG